MEIDKEKIIELKEFVFDGYYQKIDAWFKLNIINKKREDLLVFKLLDYPYFFSYRSMSTDVAELNKERLERELVILKNFKHNENKFKLFHPLGIENFSFKHLEMFNLKKKQEIINSSTFARCLTTLFFQEKFEEIEKCSSLLDAELLNVGVKVIPFSYKETSSHGCFNFNMSSENFFFTVKDEIMFNFTLEKLNCLLNKNIDIPRFEHAENVRNKILSYLEKENYNYNYMKTIVDKINNAIDYYKEQTKLIDLNFTLQETLETENKVAKKFKL